MNWKIKKQTVLRESNALAKMVDQVKQRIVNNKVFSKTIREELRAYAFNNLAEESTKFVELQKIYQQLMKKKHQEQFYAKFYSKLTSSITEGH